MNIKSVAHLETAASEIPDQIKLSIKTAYAFWINTFWPCLEYEFMLPITPGSRVCETSLALPLNCGNLIYDAKCSPGSTFQRRTNTTSRTYRPSNIYYWDENIAANVRPGKSLSSTLVLCHIKRENKNDMSGVLSIGCRWKLDAVAPPYTRAITQTDFTKTHLQIPPKKVKRYLQKNISNYSICVSLLKSNKSCIFCFELFLMHLWLVR